jgi:hypothetical protein
MLTKAITLEDMYSSFEFNRPLSEDEYAFFENIYDGKLTRFINDVRRNKVHQNIFFIAGQRGNGKSTILNNLKNKNKDFEDSYEIRHIQAMEVFDISEVDIVDILLVIGFDLIDNNKLDGAKTKELRDKFADKLQELQELSSGELEKISSEAKSTLKQGAAEGTLSTKASFFSYFSADSKLSAIYKTDKHIREEAKKRYRFKTKDLLDTINSLIDEYKKLANSPKEILLILDGLERLSNIENTDKIFKEDISLLRDVKCFKIITMPLYLKELIDINDVKPIDFTMEIKEGKIKNIENLKLIVEKRLQNKELITPEAMNLAVKMSGGNIRQLLEILQRASTEATDIFESKKVDIQEIKSALEILKGHYATRTQIHSKFLNKIKDTHTIENEDDYSSLAKTIKDGLVFAYFNGTVYYDINPIIAENLN